MLRAYIKGPEGKAYPKLLVDTGSAYTIIAHEFLEIIRHYSFGSEIEGMNRSAVIKTGWGLTIAGTRITLYDIMDYLKSGWPPGLVGNWLNLSGKQMSDAMDYIENNRAEVEREYGIVLENTEKIRQYWEERNREHFAMIAKLPKIGKEEIRAKLLARKAKLGQE